jgi:hypothetical protein
MFILINHIKKIVKLLMNLSRLSLRKIQRKVKGKQRKIILMRVIRGISMTNKMRKLI